MADLQGIDWKALIQPKEEENTFLRDMQERADARLTHAVPFSPEERLAGFERINFRPHGLYLPDDSALRERVLGAARNVGLIPDLDHRLRRYADLQDRTGDLETQGMAGHWTGQQGVSRSQARYRLVAWGRRGGKSSIAAAEAVALAISRPRSVVWCCAPIMRHVGRVFDMVLQMLADAQVLVRVRRDTNQEKLVVLDNGSRIEGVPLDNILGAAGAAVDLAIVDEAAQITADAWERAIIPPLMDRNGQALLISSYEGDEGFFARKAEQAKAQIIRTGGECPWAVFQDASYDVNFYFFPQGRQTPQLLEAEADMDPINFLEQFGAIPAGARDRVYPEFRERIHTGNYPFDPNHPVILAVDPSGGGNPYAVAVLQDYGSYVVQIDEFYESHMAVEDISPILDAREWRLNVTDVIIDGANPIEVVRWIDRGWPAFGIGDGKGINKPRIEDRIPILKIWLREPIGFYQTWRDRIDYYLAERKLPPGSEKQLPREQQNALMVQVNESFSDERMSAEEIQHMRQFARFHVDRSCVFTIEEFKRYKYVRPHRDGANLPEKPGDSYNHLMDSISYFFWHYKLFETRQGTDRTMVQPNGPVDQDLLDHTSVEPILLSDVQRRRSMWIQEARERNSPSGYRDVLRVKAF